MKKEKIIKQKKVVVAMSGGVDSSVAAVLLKNKGYDLTGIFMKLWPENYSTEAENRAKQVAEILNIPFSVFNIEKKFKKKIVDYFLREYKQGTTPNPCVNCNKEIKFGLLLDEAMKQGADYLATGHYARLSREIPNSKFQIPKIKLLRGKDKTKDQSYFLWKLNQKQLKHILFPVGDYTKIQVRKMAKKFNLPVFNAPESQEICFIKDTVNNFLTKYIKTKPGPILTIDNKKIGQHHGLPFYTIGQRKGIELSGGPFYVVDKDIKKNTLIVAHSFNDKNLYKKKLIAKDVNWIAGKKPKLPLKVKAQIRYGHKTFPALIYKIPQSRTSLLQGRQNTQSRLVVKARRAKYEILFTSPQRAITPGQSVVFYSPRSSPKAMVWGKHKELLGGGIIC